MRRIHVVLALLTAGVLSANALAAQPAVPGLNLSWEDCGAAGLSFAQWACQEDAGVVGRLHASFVLTSDLPPLTEVTGAEGVFDLYSAAATLPSWWTFQKPGSCRPSGLGVDFVSPPPGCQDYWGTRPGGPIGAFDYAYSTPGTPGTPGQARLRTIQAINFDYRGPVGTGEWYVMTITLYGNKTVGPTGCSGCQTPLAVWFNRLTVTQPVGFGDLVLTQPSERNIAGWQCPASLAAPSGFYFDCVTPAVPRTWGQVKSLYR
jgi:hypothetical protein